MSVEWPVYVTIPVSPEMYERLTTGGVDEAGLRMRLVLRDRHEGERDPIPMRLPSDSVQEPDRKA